MKLSAILLPIALAACATVTPNPTVDGGPIRTDGKAMIDETTRVGDLVVTPKAVVEDSRCPVNARCVWAGRLVLSARIDGASWHETVNLTLGETSRTHGRGIALISAEPGKIAGTNPQPAATTFSFERRD